MVINEIDSERMKKILFLGRLFNFTEHNSTLSPSPLLSSSSCPPRHSMTNTTADVSSSSSSSSSSLSSPSSDSISQDENSFDVPLVSREGETIPLAISLFQTPKREAEERGEGVGRVLKKRGRRPLHIKPESDLNIFHDTKRHRAQLNIYSPF